MEELVIVTFFIALFGGIYDLYTGKIPNWWTIPAILLGVFIQFFFFGTAALSYSILGILCATLLYLPLYLFAIMGAGDVKLLMAIGAWSDYSFVLHVAIVSIFLAAIYAFLSTIFVGRFPIFIKNFFYSARSIFLQGLPFFKPDLDKNRKFCFGISISIGTAMTIWLKNTGLSF